MIESGTVPVREGGAGGTAGYSSGEPAGDLASFLKCEFTRVLTAQYSVALLHDSFPFSGLISPLADPIRDRLEVSRHDALARS